MMVQSSIIDIILFISQLHLCKCSVDLALCRFDSIFSVRLRIPGTAQSDVAIEIISFKTL